MAASDVVRGDGNELVFSGGILRLPHAACYTKQ
jgi:hypothetical protein